MLEERHRNRIHPSVWDHTKDRYKEIYRFQTVNPPLATSTLPHHGAGISSEIRQQEVSESDKARIERLCVSLQSLLEESRKKGKRYYEDQLDHLKGPRRRYPTRQKMDIGEIIQHTTSCNVDYGRRPPEPPSTGHTTRTDGYFHRNELKKKSQTFDTRIKNKNLESYIQHRNESDNHSERINEPTNQNHEQVTGQIQAEMQTHKEDQAVKPHPRELETRTLWSTELRVLSSDQKVPRYTNTLVRTNANRGLNPRNDLFTGSEVEPVKNNFERGILWPQSNSIRNYNRRETMLVDELLETRRELKELKRSRSLLSEQFHKRSTREFEFSPSSPHDISFGGFSNDPSTDTFKSVERQAQKPLRVSSQTNLRSNTCDVRNIWTSYTNLRGGLSIKQPPAFVSTNQSRQERRSYQFQDQHGVDGGNEGDIQYVQEMITLKPIGRGFSSLEPTGLSTSRSKLSSTKGDNFSGLETPKRVLNQLDRQSRNYTSPTMFNQTDSRIHRETSNWKSMRASSNANLASILHKRSAVGGGSTSNILHTVYNGTIGGGSVSSKSLLHVRESMRYWYLPNASHVDAVSALLNCDPGSFILRNDDSNTGCYILELRISNGPQTNAERTDALERVQSLGIAASPLQDRIGVGYRLMGSPIEPVYPSMVAFVYDHLMIRRGLPVLLQLPVMGTDLTALRTNRKDELATSTSMTLIPPNELLAEVLYLGSYDAYPLDGVAAIRHSITRLLNVAVKSNKGLSNKCIAHLNMSKSVGIKIVDTSPSLLVRKTINKKQILFCSFDPMNRTFNCQELGSRGLFDAKLFAIVVKKRRFILREHAVYVMCGLDTNHQPGKIIQFINSTFLAHK